MPSESAHKPRAGKPVIQAMEQSDCRASIGYHNRVLTGKSCPPPVHAAAPAVAAIVAGPPAREEVAAGPSFSSQDLAQLAFSHRYLIISFTIELLVGSTILAFLTATPHRPAWALVLPICAALAIPLWLASAAFEAVQAKRICEVLHKAPFVNGCMTVLTVMPCISLAAAFTLNHEASKKLRQNGLNIGFFGVCPKEIRRRTTMEQLAGSPQSGCFSLA